jgi:hypothetical protein
MKWEKDIREYTAGSILILGEWNVGSAYYNSFRAKDDPLKYAATCSLPGIKKVLGYYATEQEAKDRVEVTVKYWISKSGI